MKKSNLLSVLPAMFIVLLGCGGTPEPQGDAVAHLEVSNPSTFARPDTLVSLSLNELGVTAGPLQVWEGDAPRPTQLLDDLHNLVDASCTDRMAARFQTAECRDWDAA